MKKMWIGFSAGALATGLTLWSPHLIEARRGYCVSQPDEAALRAEVSRQSTKSSEYRVDVLRAQFRSLGRSEPWAREQGDERLIEWRALLASSDAARFVQTLSSEELATPFGTAALEAWLAQDSAAASAWIAGRPEATDHHAWIVAETLIRHPQVFAAFCRGLDRSSWAQAFLDHSSRASVRENPAAAAALAESLIPGERQTRLFETIVSDWILRDPDAAQTWVHSVTDRSLRHRLVTIGAQSYASINPLGALEWLLAQSPSDSTLQEPLQTIAGIWRHTADPELIDSLDYLAGRSERLADRNPRSD